MNEHRRDERKKLISFTTVHDAHKKTLLGYLADLSMQGAMLVGERPLEVDTKIMLVINFPATEETPARPVLIPARVAWRKHEEKSQYFNTGFEFQEIDQQDKEFIETILERYQFRREMQP
jgi:c-di-GMP-binding flagellar brake protein YcgR